MERVPTFIVTPVLEYHTESGVVRLKPEGDPEVYVKVEYDVEEIEIPGLNTSSRIIRVLRPRKILMVGVREYASQKQA